MSHYFAACGSLSAKKEGKSRATCSCWLADRSDSSIGTRGGRHPPYLPDIPYIRIVGPTRSPITGRSPTSESIKLLCTKKREGLAPLSSDYQPLAVRWRINAEFQRHSDRGNRAPAQTHWSEHPHQRLRHHKPPVQDHRQKQPVRHHPPHSMGKCATPGSPH